MRRLSFFLIALFMLALVSGAQPAAEAQSNGPATHIKVLLPNADTTWVVGKMVAVRWMRGKYPWLKVTIQLFRKPKHGWSGTLPPLFTVKNLPDNGHWAGNLKNVPAGPYFIRIKRGMAQGSSPAFKIVTKK